jgi:exosortase H (IPTLxxWG-CTERM-specific)
MVRFFLGFILLQALLFGSELTPWAQRWFVAPWTDTLATISAAIVKLFDPAVVADGNLLESARSDFAVSIEAGCNGVEATIVLVAAILAFPASWNRKIAGLALGIVAVQALNVIRVISLFYLGQWSFDAFDFAHRYVWQALIMLDVLVVWLLWVRALPRAAPTPAPV